MFAIGWNCKIQIFVIFTNIWITNYVSIVLSLAKKERKTKWT